MDMINVKMDAEEALRSISCSYPVKSMENLRGKVLNPTMFGTEI
jgi:hypothetical protein